MNFFKFMDSLPPRFASFFLNYDLRKFFVIVSVFAGSKVFVASVKCLLSPFWK